MIYGQKHDPVVVNVFNRENDADRRGYGLLDQKLTVIEGVFGARDEFLGTVEADANFERRIADIYPNSRHRNEIHRAFERLLALEGCADTLPGVAASPARALDPSDTPALAVPTGA